jgi:hypothetical protein
MQATLFTILLVICTGLLVALPAHAKEGSFYGIGAAGYAANDFGGQDLDDVSYKIGVGYELGKQWNLEVGFQALGDDRLDMDELSLDNASQEINAVYLSALGRAGNRYGELFYRVGVLRADVSTDYLSLGTDCANTGSAIMVLSATVVCQSSNSNIAGVFGIGFDFYIHHSTMLRIEFEHIQGQDSFSAQAAYIGIRLNF